MSTEKAGAHGGRRPGAGRKPKGEQRDAIARFNEARADKERHLATLRRLDAEQREGHLIPLATLRDVLANAAAQIGAILDAVPVMLKREAPHLTATDLHIIEREITRARNLAANVRYRPEAKA